MFAIDDEGRYPNVQYGTGEDAPIYLRTCPICGRFVTADQKSTIPEYLDKNATCKKHGRVAMRFYCWAGDLDAEATQTGEGERDG